MPRGPHFATNSWGVTARNLFDPGATPCIPGARRAADRLACRTTTCSSLHELRKSQCGISSVRAKDGEGEEKRLTLLPVHQIARRHPLPYLARRCGSIGVPGSTDSGPQRARSHISPPCGAPLGVRCWRKRAFDSQSRSTACSLKLPAVCMNNQPCIVDGCAAGALAFHCGMTRFRIALIVPALMPRTFSKSLTLVMRPFSSRYLTIARARAAPINGSPTRS